MASRIYALMFVAMTGILGMVSPPDLALMVAQAQTTQDRKAEADRLFNQGNQQFNISQFEAAFQSYQQALNIYREIKFRQGELGSLGGIGIAYRNLGKYEKALEYQLQSLAIAREIKDRLGEGNALGNLGISYYFLGKYDKAIEFHLQALEILREIKNRLGEGSVLGNLGIAYYSLGKYDKAIEYQLQSLVISREIKDRLGEETSLGNLGGAYHSLGKYDKAIEYQLQRLEIAREIKDRLGEGTALGNLGSAYYSLGKYDKAIEYQLQRLAITREIKDRLGEGAALGNLGIAYRNLGKYDKAIEYQLQSLAITREIKDRSGQMFALNNLGVAYRELNRDREAMISYQQALTIAREIGYRSGEGYALANLGDVLSKAKRPELAILFYKQSINVREAIRKDISKLDKDIQKSYLSTVEKTYRNLADLLLKQNRILEAQQVLDLLKVEELNEYLRNVRSPEAAKGTVIQKSEKTIIALSNELAELQKLDREGNLDPQQKQRLAELTNQEIDRSNQFNQFLDSPSVKEQIKLLRRIESQNIEIGKYTQLRKKLAQAKNAAILYPLILEDRLELILVTSISTPIRKTIKISRENLNIEIQAFLSNLRNPNSGDAVRVNGSKFYKFLIEPFKKELQDANIQTIIYSPDGQLRYIPIAALYDDDSKQWLVEKYRINNITSSLLTDFTPRTNNQPHVLAAAATQSRDIKIGDLNVTFGALPATKTEVNAISALISKTTTLIDSQFSKKELIPIMQSYSILHFATHGHFEGGDPENSFILYGDGTKATLKDIEGWTLTNVDLVILSACETAISGTSNGIAIMGLGYQIQDRGAGAAIATLWKVSDGGTQKLMNAFYTVVKTGKVSNVEALRQAQVAMITGNSEGLGEPRSIVSIEARPRATSSTIPTKISHPYYWAAFILIGNGL